MQSEKFRHKDEYRRLPHVRNLCPLATRQEDMVIYVPLLEIIDCVIYVGSCIGTWFRLSAISINDIVLSVTKGLKSKLMIQMILRLMNE